MYLRSQRRRIRVTAWLIPLLIVLIVAAAIIFDYREQHRTFEIFGTSVDAHNIRQILVQPQPDNPNPKALKVYKITAYNQVISVLQVLAEATPVKQSALPKNSSTLDNMYVEFQNQSWELNLFQSPLSNHLYVQYNGELFETPTQIVQTIKQQKS